MQEFVVKADMREHRGKHAKYSRANKMVPGVYYARGENNLTIEILDVDLDRLVYTSQSRIIDLQLKDGSSRKCILRDVQFDPVSDRPIHFDLQGLKENEKLTIEVPVTLVGGVPVGVRDGGMLQQFLHRLKISCLPKDIPERVEIKVAELKINDFVHVSDIGLPNVTILDNAENAVVGVMPPHIVKEETPVEGVVEEAKEPEVVAKGKKAEEEGEGAEAAPKEKKEAPAKEK
jgi:large subunit ribosomal protein L25